MKSSVKTPKLQLYCPYCQTPLKVDLAVDHFKNRALKTGIVHCICDVYPVVNGIWFLHKETGLRHQQAAQLIAQKQIQAALSLLLTERKKVKIWFRLLAYLSQSTWFKENKPIIKRWFLRCLALMNQESKDWYRYLSSRSQRSTFILSLLTLAKMKPGQVIVDVGCGQGNFLAMVKKNGRVRQSIGVDSSFSLLLFARWFEVEEDQQLICCDIELGMPFGQQTIDIITINDAFMYIRNKQSVITSMQHCLRPTGLLALIHVHLRSANNLGQGFGVSLAEMTGYFAKTGNTYLAPDHILLAKMIRNGSVFWSNPKRITTSGRSYSWIYSRKSIGGSWVLPTWVVDFLGRTKIDYTEDEDLRPKS